MNSRDAFADLPPAILVPLDGSPLAERVLPYAARLARLRGARLLLLRAIVATAPASEAASRLATLARVWRDAGVAVETRCATLRTHGNDLIAEAILAVANTQAADLIAMSTHGRSGLGGLLNGSVAEHVLRYAETPVLLVPGTVDHQWPEDRPLRLLVPLDGSRHAESALGTVIATLADIPTEVVVARVVEFEASDYLFPDPPSDVAERQALDGASAYLDAVANSLRAIASSVEIETAIGEPAEALVRMAHDRHVDLIAMTTHGRNGRGPAALGSTALQMLRRTEVPLLLRRPMPSEPSVVGCRRRSPPAALTERIGAGQALRGGGGPMGLDEVNRQTDLNVCGDDRGVEAMAGDERAAGRQQQDDDKGLSTRRSSSWRAPTLRRDVGSFGP